MTREAILSSIGQFTGFELELFDEHVVQKVIDKDVILLREHEICQSFYFILSGALVQFQNSEIQETIIDLHLENEWMYNHESLIEQTPSKTIIRAFERSEVLALSLQNFHYLCSRSPAFLQFSKLFNQDKIRTHLYDSSLTPTAKYDYINIAKPGLARVFPVKMIASYLKIAPETLSRVRAR